MANTHSLDLEASSSQYASVADQAIFDGLSTFSIECWLKFESIADDMQPITKWGATNATTAWRLITAGGKLRLVIGDGLTSGDVDANQTISTGLWYHFAFTWNGSLSVGSRAKAYVNGVDVTANDDTLATMNAGTAGLYVGNREGLPAGGYYDGLIDDIRIWNTVRTPSEIANNYKAELTGSESGLVGYWKLNNNYNDSTSNGNNLTASGSPVFSADTPLDLTYGLVSYWKLDESSGNASDSVGSNTLTNNNSASYAAGKINNGVDLETSSSQSLTCADNASLSITGDMSISLWVKPESLVANQVIIGKWASTSDQRSYAFFINSSGVLRAYISSDGTNANTSKLDLTATTLSAGTMYYLTFVYDASAGSISLYINGSLNNTSTGHKTSIYNSTSIFGLGNNLEDFDYFDGIIDEAALYNRILTSDEVTSLYNSGAGLTYPFTTTSSTNSNFFQLF